MIHPDLARSAETAFGRHAALHRFDFYTGIFALQGLAHLALVQRDERLVRMVRGHLMPFVRGERQFPCNLLNYRCGGNASALLLWHGHLPEAREPVRQYAEQLIHEAPRDRAGIYCFPKDPAAEQLWIDAAWAVVPFLAYAGRALEQPQYLEEACDQIRKMIEVLRDPENQLLHQCRGFSRPGQVTEDHWSRGNGWGMIALAELLDALPSDHHRRAEIEALYRELAVACLRHQAPDGLWHQEMTRPDSFAETSGSGMILYALGVGLDRGLLPGETRAAFTRGLASFLGYVGPDGSVRNTCPGCKSPGDGSIEAYLQYQPVTDDDHAFAPVILACTVALRLGLTSI